jgi:hypothetical protein
VPAAFEVRTSCPTTSHGTYRDCPWHEPPAQRHERALDLTSAKLVRTQGLALIASMAWRNSLGSGRRR